MGAGASVVIQRWPEKPENLVQFQAAPLGLIYR